VSEGIVIAGGGLAAQRCAETLRRSGYDGRVRMICAEPRRPYDRPPLSKAILAGDAASADVAFRPEAWYADHDVELLLGVSATGLDPRRRIVELSGGGAVRYDELLIATGSRPRTLPLLSGYANVSTLRTLDDAASLRGVLRPGAHIVIAGAGLIGQEVAAAARSARAHVTIVEPAAAPLEALLGPAIGDWFADLHRAHGVELVLGARIARALGSADRLTAVVLDDGRTIATGHVVVGIGVDPAVAWVAGSGLDPLGVRAGVDGRTALPGVFAAGDAAATWDPVLRRHVAGGHWEQAGRQGAAAARAMLGLDVRPAGPASFWSDLYGTRIQYLGHAGLADGHAVDGTPEARDFSVTYTRAGAPVAALLVGRPHALPHARSLLAHPREEPTCPTESSSTRAPARPTATARTSRPRSSASTTWRRSSGPVRTS
jgi:NADPH-dependent 2,4-dienoyl-CoA reductase/sulfur reductase-like enzyme